MLYCCQNQLKEVCYEAFKRHDGRTTEFTPVGGRDEILQATLKVILRVSTPFKLVPLTQPLLFQSSFPFDANKTIHLGLVTLF